MGALTLSFFDILTHESEKLEHGWLLHICAWSAGMMKAHEELYQMTVTAVVCQTCT